MKISSLIRLKFSNIFYFNFTKFKIKFSFYKINVDSVILTYILIFFIRLNKIEIWVSV